LKPSVYSLNDFDGIVRKNKLDVLQILQELQMPIVTGGLAPAKANKVLAPRMITTARSLPHGDDSLPLVYETETTCDLSYAGMMRLAKQKGIKVKVILVSKRSERFVSLAQAWNPKTKIMQFGAASYPITMRFSDEVIQHIVGRLALRNAIEKVPPRQEALLFIYKAVHSGN
jgi:hypothetical protein